MTRQTLSTAPAVAGAPSIVAPEPAGAPIGFVEFVALVAALMSLAALGIDSMLPALPAMGRSLGVATENQRQFIITAFILGFGIAQLAHGPLADRYGRRAVLLWAIGGYVVANIACAVSARRWYVAPAVLAPSDSSRTNRVRASVRLPGVTSCGATGGGSGERRVTTWTGSAERSATTTNDGRF